MMFSALSGNFKLYGLIALGAIVAGFLIVFKMRGMKIAGLQGKLKEAEASIKVAVETQRRAKVTRKTEKDIEKVIREAEADKDGTEQAVSKMMEQSTIKKVSTGL